MQSLASLDRLLFTWLNGLHAPWLDPIMVAASYLGIGGAVWLTIAAVLFFFPARRPAAWRLVMAIALAQLTVDGVLKPIAGRDRPFVGHEDVRVIFPKRQTFSFPSGHATQAMVGAAAASQAVPGAQVAWWVLAGVIAISRIYVGVHFPIDVLSGIILGLLCARLVLGGVKPHGAPFAPGPIT
jgi:undecaprenyl-diphosphatase